MNNTDTVKLLRECDAGSKMAVSAIDEVLEKVHDSELARLLNESKQHHSKLGNDIHSLLERHQCDDKEPNVMAKGMSWLKTNLKMGIDESDATIADLITDGCNMGIKSLFRYLNQYQTADEQSKNLCKKLISIEEQLNGALRKFL